MNNNKKVNQKWKSREKAFGLGPIAFAIFNTTWTDRAAKLLYVLEMLTRCVDIDAAHA